MAVSDSVSESSESWLGMLYFFLCIFFYGYAGSRKSKRAAGDFLELCLLFAMDSIRKLMFFSPPQAEFFWYYGGALNF